MGNTEFKHIIRVVNTDLDGNKHLVQALRKIRGVGVMMANAICNAGSLEKTKKAGNLSNKEVEKIIDILKGPLKYNLPIWMLNRRKSPNTGDDVHIISSDIKFIQDNDIKLMKKIKCYKGIRHMSGLPVRGQRTKSNFRRNKGKVTGVKRKKGAKSGK